MKETTYRKKLCKELRGLGALILPIVGSTNQFAGVPDFYMSHAKWQGFIEMKGEFTTLRAIQIKVMSDLIKTGTSCYVVRYPNQLQTYKGDPIAEFTDGIDLLEKLKKFSEKE